MAPTMPDDNANDDANDPALDPKLFRRHPAEYTIPPIDGDYATAAQKKPFHLEVRYGDIHIFSGWRFREKAYDSEGNTVYMEAQRVIKESIMFIRREGEVELGSCGENRIPGPDTLEALLRQFSINGNLASYLPAVLERLGAIRIEKRAKGVHWVVPADRGGDGGDGEGDADG